MGIRLTRDGTFRVVLNLRTPLGGGNIVVGTGIFLLKDNSLPFILTATHVAKACQPTTEIVISDENGDSHSISITKLNPTLAWKHHPVADVSVLPLTPDPSLAGLLQDRFFPLEQLNTTNLTPSRDAYLTCVGFPQGMGASGKFSPLTFRSHASSSLCTFHRFDTKTPCDFFILENPSVGGYSGGPIFDLGYIAVGAMVTYTGHTICHGIMHGTISDDTGGKLAAVTPCSYVKDLV